MENAISYYYDMNAFDIRQKENLYKFKYNNDSYVLQLYQNDANDIESIYELCSILRNYGIYCHKIVHNKENKAITYINGKPYVLMLISANMDKKIALSDIVTYNIDLGYFNKLKISNWKELWMNKIDYFEYQVSQLGLKYPIIRESFSYFVGLAENGISLLNEVPATSKNYLCHRRIKKNMTLFDLYNPLNIVVDSKIRDVSEYFKDCFLEDEDIFIEIRKYLIENNLSEEEMRLFFIRMMYPSFYFDKYDEIMKNDRGEEEIKKIILSIDSYEELLRNIYLFIGNYIIMPSIEWIKKT